MRQPEQEAIPHVTQWVIISGTRQVTEASQKAVQETVRGIMTQGGGVVVGAGDGTDVRVIQEALAIDPKRLRVFLIEPLLAYRESRQRKSERPDISLEERQRLTELVETLDLLAAYPESVKITARDVSQDIQPSDSYDELNKEMLAFAQQAQATRSPAFIYFKVGEGRGTQAAIDAAEEMLHEGVFNGLDASTNPYLSHDNLS